MAFVKKNVTKNLNGALGIKWAEFIKSFYKCIDEYDEEGFLNKWEQLKINYPAAFFKNGQELKVLAPCYNHKIFMADMTTTGRGESMNNLMKGYMDATTSLTAFLKAFESALDQRKEDIEIIKFCEDYTNTKLVTKSLYEKQAMDLLTNYALNKTQKQLIECMM